MNTKWSIRIAIGIALSILLYIFFPVSEPNPRPAMWNIQSGKQLSILDLDFQSSQLQDAVAVLKAFPDIALFTKRQRDGQPEPEIHLEAYFEDLFDEGDRIIIGLNADMKLLQHIKKQAFQPQLFPNDVIRVGVKEEHIQTISSLPIKAISIILGEYLKYDDFAEQYGPADKIIDDGQGNAHFLYAKMGLDFIQPADGLQILQFVSPEHFEADLLNPLMKSLPQQTQP